VIPSGYTFFVLSVLTHPYETKAPKQFQTTRKGFGYPYDDYFFLKVFDASRRTYVSNHKSQEIQD
jgi:hypothetical protein